jgi:hypothetical protein
MKKGPLPGAASKDAGKPPLLKAGSSVQIEGLKADGDLNGRVGTVAGYDQSKGRYRVKVGGDGDISPLSLSINANNLSPRKGDFN